MVVRKSSTKIDAVYFCQGVVTTIPAVLTPATGGFDPVPLRTPQKVGGYLRILQIDQKINDFSS